MIHTTLQRGRDVVKEIEVIIDTEEIAEFFYRELIRRGFVPTQTELEELADITFDYLLEKCIIDEELDIEDDE
jgi:ERCC4-type nuclease